MTMISVVGAKGGSGGSLLATNLGVALAAKGRCLLIDLNPMLGCVDLLLDIEAEKSWLDLLPVAGELTEHHLSLAIGSHASGLQLLVAPRTLRATAARAGLVKLLKDLRKRTTWLLLDLSVVDTELALAAFPITDMLLLVSTMEPQSLRSLKRLSEELPSDLLKRTGLVFNQVTRNHPANPEAVASSLGLPSLAVLPVDQPAISRQVHFGQPSL
jgi:pilus assembly protein CpaE